MRKAGRRIFPSHGTGEPKALFNRYVGGHANTTDRNPAGGVVDDHNRFQPGSRAMNVHDLRWTKIVCELKAILHGLLTVRKSNPCHGAFLPCKHSTKIGPHGLIWL